MAVAPRVRAKEIATNEGMEVPPFAFTSGRLTNAAAVQMGICWVAPCDLVIENIVVNIDTAFTNAASKLNIGSVADDDAYVDAMVVYNIGTGTFQFDPDQYLGVIGKTIPKGATFGFTLDAADTTGKLTAVAVCRPA